VNQPVAFKSDDAAADFGQRLDKALPDALLSVGSAEDRRDLDLFVTRSKQVGVA
jgi:hypothetical protein